MSDGDGIRAENEVDLLVNCELLKRNRFIADGTEPLWALFL